MSGMAQEILKVASKAIKEARRKSLEDGVLNMYSKNGNIYFQLANGDITQEKPKVYDL